MENSSSVHAELMPSQAINSRSRPPKRSQKPKKAETKVSEAKNEEQTSSTRSTSKPRGRPRNRKKKGKPKDAEPPQETPQDTSMTEAKATPPQSSKSKKRNKPRKRYPWRKHIPVDSVDPITLESLQSLPYPPFALVATEPYDPVPIWPIPDCDETESRLAIETQEDREKRIMQEQWGEKVAAVVPPKAQDDDRKPPSKRHYHLFDGRALAYYMVSQLQFIDPLNRRDLTRDELVGLDRYLRRHGFTNLNVTEAYDVKGVTLSSAGAVANTAQGRAQILQQEAGVLLHALFGGMSVSTTSPTAASSSNNNNYDLRSQYQAREQVEEYQPAQPDQFEQQIWLGPNGSTTADASLRSTAPEFVPSTLWSGSRVTSRHSSGGPVAMHEFPSLSDVASRPNDTNEPAPGSSSRPQKKAPPPSKTLASIGGAVKKTDPEELQRQWEAREEARRRAALSNLTFGSNPAAWDGPQQASAGAETNVPSTITTLKEGQGPSEAQLERNRAFAEALGVKPATVRKTSLKSGWARPSETTAELDEFGNELNAVIYPDALIVKAREYMGPLLKLEKKWKSFLADDSAASLPLNRMDRPLRTFVHEYSDYWKLHTQSFDPEPRRYIHCVKMQDTSAPYPLLSDAARNWKGPSVSVATPQLQSDHPMQQTAGQNTRGRELVVSATRQPLALKPRTGEQRAEGVLTSGVGIGGAPTRTMVDSTSASSRFEALGARERPKLQLAKRTLPLEMPPPPEKGFDLNEELQRRREKMEELARKEQEKVAAEQRALQAAFASDSEEEESDESDWEEQEAAYDGSSDSEA